MGTSTRFAILQHLVAGGEHWDLLIEQSAALATWQLQKEPKANALEINPAKKLPDHRKVYLEYEGPVSNNRGEVKRIDQGLCEIILSSDTLWCVRLKGQLLIGQFRLQYVEADKWTFSPDTPTS